MCFIPYPPTLGQKYRRNKKLKKLNRPLSIIFNTKICECNNIFIHKYKISFLQQIIRLFYKDSLGFRVESFFKNGEKCIIEDGDHLHLICHSTKAILRKLLMRLNYEIDDYKLLKRRKYTLLFTFCICNKIIDNNIKNITLDVSCHINDLFHFFITTTSYYNKDFMQMLFYYYLEADKAIYT